MNIYVQTREQREGPFSEEELRDALVSGRFLSSDLAWYEGLYDWLPLNQALESLLGASDQGSSPNATSTTQASDHQIRDKQQKDGFVRKLFWLGSAILSEAKRKARISATKAKLEGMKLVDLRNGHSLLGQKAFDLRILPEQFQTQYDEISSLEDRIASNRAGVNAPTGASIAEKGCASALNAKMKVEATMLNPELKQLLVKLGRHIEEQGLTLDELRSELDGLNSARQLIAKTDEAFKELANDHSNQQRIRNLGAALLQETGENIRKGCFLFTNARLWRSRWRYVIPSAGLIILTGAALGFVHVKRHPSALSENNITQSTNTPPIKNTEAQLVDAISTAMQRESQSSSSVGQSAGSSWHSSTCLRCAGRGTITTPSGYITTCPSCGGSGRTTSAGPAVQSMGSFP